MFPSVPSVFLKHLVRQHDHLFVSFHTSLGVVQIHSVSMRSISRPLSPSPPYSPPISLLSSVVLSFSFFLFRFGKKVRLVEQRRANCVARCIEISRTALVVAKKTRAIGKERCYTRCMYKQPWYAAPERYSQAPCILSLPAHQHLKNTIAPCPARRTKRSLVRACMIIHTADDNVSNFAILWPVKV